MNSINFIPQRAKPQFKKAVSQDLLLAPPHSKNNFTSTWTPPSFIAFDKKVLAEPLVFTQREKNFFFCQLKSQEQRKYFLSWNNLTFLHPLHNSSFGVFQIGKLFSQRWRCASVILTCMDTTMSWACTQNCLLCRSELAKQLQIAEKCFTNDKNKGELTSLHNRKWPTKGVL